MTFEKRNIIALSDVALLANTKRLAVLEREILADVLCHLAEIQRRKLFSPRFTSLHQYAIAELGYSEDQASRRISAMFLMMELPEIEREIVSGELNLTTLNLARTHFRNEAIAGEPRAGEPAEKTIEPSREVKLATLKAIGGQTTRQATRTLIAQSSAPEKLRHFESVKPVSATMNEIKILADDKTLEKIAQLKGLLAHKHPHLSNGELLNIALDVALETLNPATRGHRNRNSMRASGPVAKAKAAARNGKPSAAPRNERLVARNSCALRNKGSAPRNDASAPSGAQVATPKNVANGNRRATAALSRDIWASASNRCETCGSVHGLERDHRRPFALGGPTTRENMRLLCRNCNQREAIRVFGARPSSRLKSPSRNYFAS